MNIDKKGAGSVMAVVRDIYCSEVRNRLVAPVDWLLHDVLVGLSGQMIRVTYVTTLIP